MTERDIAPEPDAESGAGTIDAPAGFPTGAFTAAPALRALAAPSPIRVIRQPTHRTAALRQELAEKAAATDELREALDQLRQVLDIDNAPPQPGAARRRNRLAVLGLAVLAAVGLVAYLLIDRGLDDAERSAASITSPAVPPSLQPSAQPSTQPSTQPSARSGPPSVAVSPLPWPGGAVIVPPGQVATGPGADAPGTDVQVALDDDGLHLDVVERLVLDAASTRPLALSVPSLAGFAPTTVTDLQVELDGAIVAPAAAGPAGWTVEPVGTGGYTDAVLRYRIGGGLVKLAPAAPGRVLGLVTPLTAATSQSRGSPVVVRAVDAHVVGVSCPAVTGTGAVCGTQTAGGWTATVPGTARPIVLLQITR